MSIDEEEPMIGGKEIESDDEGEPMTHFMSENLQFSKHSLLKLMTNEIGVLMFDEQMKNMFYAQGGLKGRGLRRGATIGVENFAKAMAGQDSVRRVRQLRAAATKPELHPPTSPASPDGSKDEH